MATIKQIAQKAGVSPTSVSNVLHGNTAKVSEATREKIQAILDEEKYAPNMGAMILAHSNSRIIGVILFQEPRRNETVLEDPFSSTIVGTMEHEIRMNGYFMMLHVTGDEDEVVRLARTWKLDGLVLLWVPEEICRVIGDSVDTPVVFIDCYFTDGGPGYHNVGLEDKRGGYEMARYLISMGHRDLLFLANAKIFPGGDLARFEGCREAFAEAGLALGEDRFIPLSKDCGKRDALYRSIADEHGLCSALFFSADYYAAEAVSFFQELGIGIPEKLSIAGFDDNIFARLTRPRLTTVRQDVYLKGQTAISMLMDIIAGKPIPETDIRLSVDLQVRESVRRVHPDHL